MAYDSYGENNNLCTPEEAAESFAKELELSERYYYDQIQVLSVFLKSAYRILFTAKLCLF